MWPLAAVCWLAVSLAAAQKYSPGGCPFQAVVPNFQYPAFLGRWYEQESYKKILDFSGSCRINDHTHEGIGAIGLHYSYYNWHGALVYDDGVATAAGPLNEAVLVARYGNREEPYLVLDTDYVSYAVIWGCWDYVLFNYQYLWILSRDRHPPEAFLQDLHGWLAARGLSTWFLRRTSQAC